MAPSESAEIAASHLYRNHLMVTHTTITVMLKMANLLNDTNALGDTSTAQGF